jgi:hypothetical protein
MAAYMGPSSPTRLPKIATVAIVHHTGAERAAGFSPHPEYYAIRRNQTIRAKAIWRRTISSVLHNLD